MGADFTARAFAFAEGTRNKRLRILNTLRTSMARTGLRMPGLAATLPTIILPGVAATTIATGTLYSPVTYADRYSYAGASWAVAGPVFPNNTLYMPTAGRTGNGTDPTAGAHMGRGARVRFACTAPKLELYVGYGDATNGFRLKVNGEYVATGFIGSAADGTATGSLRYIPVQWGDGTETNRALRFYELEFGSSGKWGGVRCGPLHVVQPWPQPDGLRVIVHGDSMVTSIQDSTSQAAQINAASLGDVLGQMLGQADTWCANVGGTGWYANLSGAASRFNERVVLDVVNPAPDVIYELGGRNDWTMLPTQADYQARVETWLSAVLTAKPETIVFMSAPMIENGNQNTEAGYLLIKNAKIAAAAKWPRNVAFIDNMARAWITGASGRVGAPAGLGNRDWVIGTDNAHGSIEGNRYLAWMLANATSDAIRTLIAAQ